MATRLRLRNIAASEPMPNVKQSADAINRDVATVIATYANPADMLVTAGAATQGNSSTAAEPGAAHYTHYGSFISPKLAAQNVAGTVTIALVMAEGNIAANANPRVKIYKWLAGDAFGSDLLALTTSATECPAAFPAAPVVYFNATAIVATDFADNDRIVIEIETYDNNTKTASYLHGIRFGGADAGGYGGYVEFSDDITWAAATHLRTLAATAVAPATLSRIATYYRALPATALGVATLTPAKFFTRTLAAIAQGVATLTRVPTYVQLLAATAVGQATLARVATFYRALAATAVGVPILTRTASFYRTLAAVAQGVAALAPVYTAIRTLAATAVGVASLSRVVIFVETLAATAIGQATLVRVATFGRTLAATGVGVAVLGRAATFYRTLAATAVGAPVLDRASNFYRTLSATAQGVATMTATFIGGAAATFRTLLGIGQ